MIVEKNPSPEKGGEQSQTPPSPPGKGVRGLGSRTLVGVAAVVVLVGIALWFSLFRGPRDDLGRLQGEWTYSVNGNVGGVRVEGDTWSYVPVGKTYRMTLKPDASPKQIDLAQLGEDGQPVTNTHGSKGTPVGLHGVYAIDGDSLRVTFAPMTMPRPAFLDGGDTPVITLTRSQK